MENDPKPIDLSIIFLQLRYLSFLFMKLIVTQKKIPENHCSKWDPVSVYEIKTYTGRCIAMGILKLTSLRDYWQQKRSFFVVHSSGKALSPVQYKQIHYPLHSCNEEGPVPKYKPGHDPLYKIRQLLNLVILKFESLYVPNHNTCIEKNHGTIQRSFEGLFHQSELHLTSKHGYFQSQNQDLCMVFH